MAHHENENNLSPEEKKFRDYLQHADDFFKIEIFRSAKSWYKKALEMNMETEYINGRIAECDRLLTYERKVFTILGVVATIAIVLIFIIN